jgi:hypothetical protein
MTQLEAARQGIITEESVRESPAFGPGGRNQQPMSAARGSESR